MKWRKLKIKYPMLNWWPTYKLRNILWIWKKMKKKQRCWQLFVCLEESSKYSGLGLLISFEIFFFFNMNREESHSHISASCMQQKLWKEYQNTYLKIGKSNKVHSIACCRVYQNWCTIALNNSLGGEQKH